MKNLLSTIIFYALTTSAFSATTGNLLLQGGVAQKLSITVTAESIASMLDLSTSQTDLKVATVNEISNSRTGYNVTITSTNLSHLKRNDGPELFAYTLKYNNSTVDLGTMIGTTVSNSTIAAVNVNKDVSISYIGTPTESMVQGTYSDTVTFTISAI